MRAKSGCVGRKFGSDGRMDGIVLSSGNARSSNERKARDSPNILQTQMRTTSSREACATGSGVTFNADTDCQPSTRSEKIDRDLEL